jgi:adenylosuccinate lyase
MTAFLGSVSESLGDESRFIHLGLTSSDVIDTALSLQLVEAIVILNQDIKELISVLAHKAMEHKYTVMIGRTHGVHAEPISFGLKLALWVDEMRRNQQRLSEARRVIAVGKISGAVGTYATVPPEVEEKACAKLGLAPAPVSSQILQRDRHAQFVTTLAIIASSLEKFATEIRALQRTEIREVEEPFAGGQTGSSAMPHKRNPELCERICGLARLVRGYALTSIENIVLWHERDISHSSAERITLPGSCLLLDYCLALFTSVMSGLKIDVKKMKQNLELTKGLIFSQRVMLALIGKGLSRQKAYELVQRSAMRAWKGNKNFLTLLKADTEVTAILSPGELEPLFDAQYYLHYIHDIFTRLGLTRAQWKGYIMRPDELMPRAL